GGEGAERTEGARRVRREPLEEAACAVPAHRHPRARFQPLQEGTVGALRRLDEDVIKVTDRLVVVDAEAEREPVSHAPAGPTLAGGRGARRSARSRPRPGSASA